MLVVKNVEKIFKKRIKNGSWFKNLFIPKYEDFQALKGINFEIDQGEKVAFIGPNGAGKSTTIKAMLGILHYDKGEISIFDKDPKKQRKEISKFTSSVFGQRSQLLYHLPLMDSFNFFKIIYDIPQDVFEKRLDRFVKRFGIDEFINQPVRKLSLGQRMKGEIVASLLHNPKAIFLDEPTVGLDIIAKKVLYEILNEIHKEENITIFLTSHDLKDVENLCDRAIIINRGEVLYDGQIEDLMKKYANKKFISYKEKGSLERNDIEVPNEAKFVEMAIKELYENKKIKDLEIQNVPLEEIIEQFYK
ncbi:ATP-binding cassette domain-containing protein [Candidatus Gracilibacteria bacterium]|nr:ATP-binding cassette domain-containing protein [Candidatus Gracilibacteria bacterium]